MRITKWWPIFPIRITGGPLQMDAEVSYGGDTMGMAECKRCYHVDDATLNILTEKQSWRYAKTGPCQSARCHPMWNQSIRKWWCHQCDRPIEIVRPTLEAIDDNEA